MCGACMCAWACMHACVYVCVLVVYVCATVVAYERAQLFAQSEVSARL